MWDNLRISHQKEVLYNQLKNKNGRFAVFILRMYRYIENECKLNESNWCYASKVNRKAVDYIYDGPVDHMWYEVIQDVKRYLKEMGYIKYIKDGEKWKIYIIKEIDFCNIDEYI